MQLLKLMVAFSNVITNGKFEFTADDSGQIFPNSTYPSGVDPAAEPGAKFLQTSPPFYPSPWGTGTLDWADAYAQARDFVSQLTLLEKVNLTTGVGYATTFSWSRALKLSSSFGPLYFIFP
jgi:hypothetical protein